MCIVLAEDQSEKLHPVQFWMHPLMPVLPPFFESCNWFVVLHHKTLPIRFSLFAVFIFI